MASEARLIPEEYKESLLASKDIAFSDGSVVTPGEIWDYLENAPQEFPMLKEARGREGRGFSHDLSFVPSIKHLYLNLTLSERMEKAKRQGVPIAFRQGGHEIDPFTAAGTRALRPPSVIQWGRDRQKRKNTFAREQFEIRQDREKALKDISFECCQTSGYECIQAGDLPVDIVVAFTNPRCADVYYSTEAHRHGKRAHEVDRFLIDYPLNKQADKEWAIQYFAENLRRLTERLDRFQGKRTTDEDLRNAIKFHNRGRRLSREISELWWSADVPPTNSSARSNLFAMGALEMHADPVATLSVLEEAKDHLKERVKNGVLAKGIEPHAKRIYVLGACVSPNARTCEQNGAIIVGHDDFWSHISLLVEEEGDPYYNLAKTTLEYPYEQPIIQRAEWEVDQIKKSRADGVIFMYSWGCNTQSSVARPISDYIKQKTGLRTVIFERNIREMPSEQEHTRTSAFIEMLRSRVARGDSPAPALPEPDLWALRPTLRNSGVRA